ncbi:MAG: hypothetical protein AAF432_07235 [Planctomycetota bacterium]
MRGQHHNGRLAGCTRVAPIGIATLLLLGCQTTDQAIETSSDRRVIDLDAFVTPIDNTSTAMTSDGSGSSGDPAVSLPANADEPRPVRLGASIPSLDEDPFETESRPPVAPAANGNLAIIDRMVGQVNGRPIYADEFFAPIDSQLRAMSEEMTTRQFAEQSQRIIFKRLREVVLNQLLLAEAESELTGQQQQGLFALIREFEENLTLNQGGGTRSGLAERLAEEEGITIEEALASRREELLISNVYRERVLPRVIVSWRDVQNEYEKRFEEFNPPAELVLSRIRLRPERQPDKVTIVETRLAGGDTFATIADDVGMPDEGRWETFIVDPDTGVDIAIESVRDAVLALQTGEWTGPLDVGSQRWWIHLDEVIQDEARSLYDPDLQRQLENEIASARQQEEEQRFFGKLFQRGIYDELDSMVNRLVEVALDRYTAL